MTDTVLNKTYTQLIEQAIADFDTIGAVLVNRKLIANMSDGSVKTAQYAGLMSNHLFTVGNNLAVNDVGSSNIADKRTSTVEGGASTISYTEDTVNFTIKGKTLGLYGPDSTLTGSFNGVSAVLTGNLTGVSSVNITTGEGAYVVTPKENEVIKSLSINKASITLDVFAEQDTTSQSDTATLEFGTAGLTSGTFVTSTPGDASSYVEITSTASGEIKGNISATASAKAVTGGYIASIDEIEDVSIANTKYSVEVDKSESLWIKKTSVPTLTTSTTNTITATAGSGVLADGITKYVINLASPAITYSGQIDAGYLEAGSNVSVTGSAGTGTAYITAGAVGTISKEIGIAVTNNNSLQLNSSQSGAYEIVLNLADGNTSFETKTYTSTNGVAGFVDSGNTTTTITGVSKTLKIAKAVENLSGTVTIKATTQDTPFIEGNTGDYRLVVDADSLKSISRDVITEGYVKSADTTTNNITSKAKTFSINRFSGSLGTSLTSTLINGETADGAGEDALKSAIIFTQAEWDKLDEAVKKGDHYTLQSNATISGFKAGYMASKLADANQTYYLPKAKVEYRIDDEANEILQVTQGGYLPAGFIGEITNAGSIQQATFTISATTGEDNIIKSKAAHEGEDVYRIQLSKTVATSGYIGNAEGTILNADLLYIDHGSVSGTTTAGTITLGAPTARTISDVKKYVISASNTSTAKISVTEGYVKDTDIKVNGAAQENDGTINITSSGTINLDVATLKLDSAKGVTLTPDTNVELVAGTGTSAYTIGAVVADGSTVILDAASAGYIMPGDKTTGVAVSTDNFSTTTKYIKAGTGVTIALTSDQLNKELLQSDFTTTKEEGEDYTISVKSDAVLATNATVGIGYYGADEITTAAQTAQNLNISGAIEAISVPHGKASITGAGTMSLTANGLQLHESTASGYHVLTLGYADATQAATVTEGYIKTGEVAYKYGTAASARTYSIKDTGIYTATAGNGLENNKETVITAAGTYASQNITVTLHADATGSAVDAQLLALQNRLNGF